MLRYTFASLLIGSIVSASVAASGSCSAYPEAQALVQHCSTGSAFCETYLGRGPSTKSVTNSRTRTRTIPSTTTGTITHTASVTDATITVTSTTLTTSTTTDTSYVATTCSSNSNAKRTFSPTHYGPSCGVNGMRNPPPRAGVSAACSCLIDTTIHVYSTTTVTSVGTSVKTRDIHVTSTDYLTSTAISYGSPTTTVDTVVTTITGPPQSVTVDGFGYSYSQYFYGTGVREDPDNPGIVPFPPITTTIDQPQASAACALQICADFNFLKDGDGPGGSFDLHYLIQEDYWECIAYFFRNSNASYFDITDGNVGDVYGYS